jgi:hypothetical protein
MAYVAIVSTQNGRVTKFKDGFATQAEAEAHAATFGGEAVDASSLDGPVAHWIKSGDPAVWSVSGPTDAQRAALIALDRTDFLFALAQAVSQPFSTIVSYVSGVIDASDMSALDKDLAKGLLTYAVKFHRVDPDIGADLLNAVGAELSLTPAQIDTLFLTAAGQS